jgi:hypothetical protein
MESAALPNGGSGSAPLLVLEDRGFRLGGVNEAKKEEILDRAKMYEDAPEKPAF